jgi:hypothetical protein
LTFAGEVADDACAERDALTQGAAALASFSLNDDFTR